MRQHRSRQRTTKVPTEVTLKSKVPFSDGRNHPNPSFEKEGLKSAFRMMIRVILNLFQDLVRQARSREGS